MTLARSTVLGSACLVILAVALYLAKTEAERVRDHVAQLERELVDQRKDVRILEAELVWRAGPQRLEAAAQAAGLVPVTPAQIVALADLDAALSPPASAGKSSQTRPAPPDPAPAPAPAPVPAPASGPGPVAEADQ
jgi:hypothetical protein